MENTLHCPFLYYLFTCCGANYQEFVTEINVRIEMEVEYLYKVVKDNVSRRKITEDRLGVIPSKFSDFVQKMEKSHNKRLLNIVYLNLVLVRK